MVLKLALSLLGVVALLALAAPETPRLDIVVSEIAWMGITTFSSNDKWIALYNNTGGPIDLTGSSPSATDGTSSTSLSGTIPASGYFHLGIPTTTRCMVWPPT
jgi:hypothetical protein